MVSFHISNDLARGSIHRSEFESWPASIQEEFLSTVHIEGEKGGFLYFWSPDGETFEATLRRLIDKVRSRDKARKRSQRLLIESEGVYEQEDIEELFLAQEGRCYYSGANLKWSPRDFVIDHLVPVKEGGSSWPGNLVLCQSHLNTEKAVLSRQKFFKILKARFGAEWYESHKPFLKETDARRRIIDKRRRQAIQAHIDRVADELRSGFPDTIIDFSLEEGRPTLQVGYCQIRFPYGFLRQKRRFNSLQHIKSIVGAILANGSHN